MGAHFLEVNWGGLTSQSGSILSDLNFSILKGQVTVVLGPSGTGKSLLLQAMARRIPQEVSSNGSWVFATPQTDADGTNSFFLPQRRHRDSSGSVETTAVNPSKWHWQEILRKKAEALFLDEPVTGLNENETHQFIETLKQRNPQQTVVMITHNLKLAMAVADQILMVCAGRIEAIGPAEEFFTNPPTELAKKFVTTGNCWPTSDPLSLPTHFRWIIPGKMAGMGKPGLLREVDLDLESIGLAGVTHLVSLTTQPVPTEKLQSFGIQGRHFRITDMQVPSLNAAASVIAAMEKRIKQGQAVVYHCRAGLGRTGTMLACHLTWQGVPPMNAINGIRKLQPGYIQNKAQLDFVFQFAKTFCKPSTASVS